jgi:hypothetical protein
MVLSADNMNQGRVLENISDLTGSTDPFGPDSSHKADGTENAEEEGDSAVKDAHLKPGERLETLQELCEQIH